MCQRQQKSARRPELDARRRGWRGSLWKMIQTPKDSHMNWFQFRIYHEGTLQEWKSEKWVCCQQHTLISGSAAILEYFSDQQSPNWAIASRVLWKTTAYYILDPSIRRQRLLLHASFLPSLLPSFPPSFSERIKPDCITWLSEKDEGSEIYHGRSKE